MYSRQIRVGASLDPEPAPFARSLGHGWGLPVAPYGLRY
jgi:hypothetical protein